LNVSPLNWQSLVFLIPLGVGFILAIGAALGHGGGVEPAGDAAGDQDDGDDHPGHGDGVDGLAVGRMPLLLRAMVFSLVFGGLGLCLGYLLGDAGGGGRGQLAATIAAAGAGAWWSTRRIARLFARRLPLLETEAVARWELVGATGRAVLAIGPASGLAQVRDRRGNLHQVACRTLAGEPALAAGAEVLLVEHDERGNLYRVAATR
jgi:hypothetical protein